MKDLFGIEIPLDDKGNPVVKKFPNRIYRGLIRVYGVTDGRKCKNCGNFRRKEYSKTYFKCTLIGDTNGPGTDIRANWPACGKFKPKKDE